MKCYYCETELPKSKEGSFCNDYCKTKWGVKCAPANKSTKYTLERIRARCAELKEEARLERLNKTQQMVNDLYKVC